MGKLYPKSNHMIPEQWDKSVTNVLENIGKTANIITTLSIGKYSDSISEERINKWKDSIDKSFLNKHFWITGKQTKENQNGIKRRSEKSRREEEKRKTENR